MQVKVTRTYMRHSGGTKFYEIVQVFNPDVNDESVTFFRWGKTGAVGQGQITFGPGSKTRETADNQMRAKAKRGYGAGRTEELSYSTADQLRGALQGIHPDLNFERSNAKAWASITSGMTTLRRDEPAKPKPEEPAEPTPSHYGAW